MSLVVLNLMNILIENLIKGIRESDLESFVGAGEVARAHVFGTDESVGILEPYNTELRNAVLSEGDIEALRKELIIYITNNLPGKEIAAIKALSSFHNPADIELLTKLLEKQLEQCMEYNATLGQMVVALDNCGEKILQNASYSIMDPTGYISDALKYVHAKTGKVMPW